MSYEDTSASVLAGSLYGFGNLSGPDLIKRCEPLAAWVDDASRAGLFQFLRHHVTAPDTESDVVAWGGHRYHGVNLASQDYLGLARHPRVQAAAADASLR